MTDKDKKERAPQKPASVESEAKTDKTEKEKSEKKPWELAPRTGQRHANPFQRKSK